MIKFSLSKKRRRQTWRSDQQPVHSVSLIATSSPHE